MDDRHYIYVDGSYSAKSNCFGQGIAIYHHGQLIKALNGFGRNELKNLAGELQAAREAVNVKKLRERYYVSIINNYEDTSNYVKKLRQIL